MVKVALRAFWRGCKAFWGQFLELIAIAELMLSANHLNQVFCQQLHLALDVNCLEVEVVI